MKKFKEHLLEATNNISAFGKTKTSFYAVKLNGVSSNDFLKLPTSKRLSDTRFARDWKDTATLVEIPAAGKDSLNLIKQWVKENNPSEFYATWIIDSHAFGKSFTVDMYYIK